jgi:hypothetical protein
VIRIAGSGMMSASGAIEPTRERLAIGSVGASAVSSVGT